MYYSRSSNAQKSHVPGGKKRIQNLDPFFPSLERVIFESTKSWTVRFFTQKKDPNFGSFFCTQKWPLPFGGKTRIQDLDPFCGWKITRPKRCCTEKPPVPGGKKRIQILDPFFPSWNGWFLSAKEGSKIWILFLTLGPCHFSPKKRIQILDPFFPSRNGWFSSATTLGPCDFSPKKRIQILDPFFTPWNGRFLSAKAFFGWEITRPGSCWTPKSLDPGGKKRIQNLDPFFTSRTVWFFTRKKYPNFGSF